MNRFNISKIFNNLYEIYYYEFRFTSHDHLQFRFLSSISDSYNEF